MAIAPVHLFVSREFDAVRNTSSSAMRINLLSIEVKIEPLPTRNQPGCGSGLCTGAMPARVPRYLLITQLATQTTNALFRRGRLPSSADGNVWYLPRLE